jgi:hypothetical protein
MDRGALSLGVKRPVHEPDLSLPPRAELKNVLCSTSTSTRGDDKLGIGASLYEHSIGEKRKPIKNVFGPVFVPRISEVLLEHKLYRLSE